MIELRDARYFLAVAEELNFGRAADRLHMSQPPLSQAIKQLEQRLGTQLLYRTTREVRLTAAGAVLVEQCRVLLATAAAAERSVKAASAGLRGELRVGAVTSAVTHPLRAALTAFRHTHPDVEVRVDEVDTHIAVAAIQRRELDLALVRLLATPAGCRRHTLVSEPFVLAIPDNWPLAQRKTSIDLAAASDLPWIWLPRQIAPDYHDQVVACCRAADFAPDARHGARSITSQLAMVAAGLGVALVPRHTATSTATTGVHLIRLRHTVNIELAAIWRADASTAVTDLVDSTIKASR